MHIIAVRDLGLKSIFKLGLISNLAIWLPLTLIFSTGALLGFDTVTFNRAEVHGVAGFLVGWLVGIVGVILGTILFTLGAAIAGRLGASITVAHRPNEEVELGAANV